jgi:hypothetical protein
VFARARACRVCTRTLARPQRCTCVVSTARAHTPEHAHAASKPASSRTNLVGCLQWHSPVLRAPGRCKHELAARRHHSAVGGVERGAAQPACLEAHQRGRVVAAPRGAEGLACARARVRACVRGSVASCDTQRKQGLRRERQACEARQATTAPRFVAWRAGSTPTCEGVGAGCHEEPCGQLAALAALQQAAQRILEPRLRSHLPGAGGRGVWDGLVTGVWQAAVRGGSACTCPTQLAPKAPQCPLSPPPPAHTCEHLTDTVARSNTERVRERE